MSENDYGAEQIKVLSGLEGVRKRPSMYIGSTSGSGLHHLVYEVVDNSIDEALAGHCSFIRVTIHNDNSVTVEDDGRGIPVEQHPTEGVSALELVMCSLHAGGKFDHSTYKVSGGLHGVGISVVNALSAWARARVKRNGKIYLQTYTKGIRDGEIQEIGETSKTGSTITFLPDPEIFTETTEFDYEIIKQRLHELAFLNHGIKIFLKDERSGAEDEIQEKGGIISYVKYLNRKRTCINEEPIYISGEKEDVQVEVAFQYYDGFSERIFSFVNNINTKEQGTHVTGFRGALTKCLNRYASDDIVPKNMRAKMTGDDAREGITCIISVRVPDPQFEGQTKTKLGNSEVKTIVESVCNEKMTVYLENHPQEAKKILMKAVDAARAREAARKAKDLTRKKGGVDVMMAGKLAECQSRKPEEREIFLVEGDSAGGSAKQGRDRKFQAILPLRGKIMNVEKARFDKILSSEEIKQIIASLGTGIGKDDFDLGSLKYNKIIIMTDADVDGAHIRTLLLTFFYRNMSSLIENGHLHIAQPPLYRIGKGKKEHFFGDDDELNNHLFSLVSSRFILKGGGNNHITGEDLVSLLKQLTYYKKLIIYLQYSNLNEEVVNFLLSENINSADQFADEDFVRSIRDKLHDKGMIVGNIRSCRWKTSCYEFDAALKDRAHLFITIGPHIPLIPEYRSALKIFPKVSKYLDTEFVLQEGEKEVEAGNWLNLLEKLRNEGFKGYSFQRYKGLGEMNAEQLWHTTMDPEMRRLVQVSIDDAEAADDIFTTLMGDKVEPRREFITTHALEVTELDI
ncbi:MAG: DNA topoisomerase (ATP-hydrolyzing) subunit B [Desulfurivibrionaceae bacterium]